MFDVIVITDKGTNVNRIRCTLKQCTIGKSRDNLVVIRGWRVAPVHCKIELTDKGLYVEDVSDGNGITVNGNTVPFYGPIRSSDVISIGNYDFRLGTASSEETAESSDAPAKAKPASNEPEDLAEKDWSMETFIGAVEESVTPEQRTDKINRQRIFMWRNRIHQDVLRLMDLRRTDVASMDGEALRQKVSSIIDEVITSMENEIPENVDVVVLKNEVLNEAVGLGPLEELLADDNVTEIMVNACDEIYVEYKGKLSKSDVTFSSDLAVLSAIERIVS
ncbi:MAG: pilus assembly protein CpaF, partial [Shewanella psychromarinicola]|uniref:FHA domain-containing protein n=1 Tax=Shewanella psychromarinicola TaxID=2487742 RepID=UPI003EED8194